MMPATASQTFTQASPYCSCSLILGLFRSDLGKIVQQSSKWPDRDLKVSIFLHPHDFQLVHRHDRRNWCIGWLIACILMVRLCYLTKTFSVDDDFWAPPPPLDPVCNAHHKAIESVSSGKPGALALISPESLKALINWILPPNLVACQISELFQRAWTGA